MWATYASGGTTIEPVVVLTDQKAPRIARDPFECAYRRLAKAISKQDPDLIVIAGYGFGDDPLNRVLADSLPDSSCPIVVITQTADEARFERTAIRALPLPSTVARVDVRNRMQVLGDGLPDAMARNEWNDL